MIITRSISHDNIAEICAIFIKDLQLIFVYNIEFNKNLLEMIKEDKEDEVIYKEAKLSIIGSILRVLRYCHHNKLILRQFSPEHIIIKPDYTPVLFNLSSAVFEDEIRIEITKLFNGFVAPEIIKEKAISVKVDIFTFGVIAFILFSYKFPYYCENRKNILSRMMQGRVRFNRDLEAVDEKSKDDVF